MTAPDHWALARPTYIENWPASLCRLSLAQADVPLSRDEARALGAEILELGEMLAEVFGQPNPALFAGLTARVDAAVRRFPKGAFVRLGSRSPKDSWLGAREGFRCKDGAKAITLLTDCSERVAEDLALALGQGYLPHIFVREWVDIPPWAEFRCFMRQRRLVGVSQYQYLQGAVFPEIAKWASDIEWAIRDVWFPGFRDACHLDDVVFDVFVRRRGRGNESEWEVRLLEINPLYEWTDPCLFDHRNGGDFDGSFRYQKAPPPPKPDAAWAGGAPGAGRARVYLAGWTRRFRELRDLRGRIATIGMEVTSRWLDQPDERLARPSDAGLPAGVAAEAAADDLADVCRADVLVLAAEGLAEGRGGAHFEAGYAHALGKAVAVLGHAPSIFYTLPGVRRFDNEAALLAWLATWPGKGGAHGGA